MTRIRLPPVDPFKARLVEEAVDRSAPAPDGLAPMPTDEQLNIDALMKQGLQSICGVLRACLLESRTSAPSRESIQNLKDAMAMLHELKDREEEDMERLTDEQLEELANK